MIERLERVFASFGSREARYVVLGAIAAVLHGVPRATFDLDILIEASEENARQLLGALADAGLGTAALITPTELLAHEITVFEDVVRIDVQTRTPGLEFAQAWARRVTVPFRQARVDAGYGAIADPGDDRPWTGPDLPARQLLGP